jgi:hypothetical protein
MTSPCWCAETACSRTPSADGALRLIDRRAVRQTEDRFHEMRAAAVLVRSHCSRFTVDVIWIVELGGMTPTMVARR